MTRCEKRGMKTIDRRGFLRTVGAAAGSAAAAAALGGCSSGEARTPQPRTTGLGLEKTSLRIGIIALTDCSPIVIAKEKGFFARHGLDVTIVKGASWAAIRDQLSHGDLDATHMLLGMPIASTMGLLGSPKLPMVVPWLLNRNGQAITLAAGLRGKVAADPRPLAPLAAEARAKGAPMTFAMTFPP